MSSTPRSAYRPDPDATPEEARDVRARAWAFIFSCWHAKGGSSATAAQDDRKGFNDDPATARIPRQPSTHTIKHHSRTP